MCRGTRTGGTQLQYADDVDDDADDVADDADAADAGYVACTLHCCWGYGGQASTHLAPLLCPVLVKPRAAPCTVSRVHMHAI